MKRKFTLISLLFLMAFSAIQLSGQEWQVYDGSDMPTDVGFSASNTRGATINTIVADKMKAGNYMLSMVAERDTMNYMFRMDLDTDPDSVTFFIKLKGISDTLDRTMEFDMQFGGSRERLYLNTDGTWSLHESGASGDFGNAALWQDFHTVRITKADSIVNCYLDENATPFATDTTSNANGNSYFRFGDGNSSNSIGTIVDYVLWDTTSVYAPGAGAALPTFAKAAADVDIVFLEIDEKDAYQIDFLKKNGFNVNVLEIGDVALTAMPQDTVDMMNDADLIIISRSCPSSQYRDTNATAWKSITTPVICNAQYVASDGKNRINWFEASGAAHDDSKGTLIYAAVSDNTDPLWVDVNVVGDSVGWTYTPDDFLAVDDTATKHNVAARSGANVLVVQMGPDSALYEGGPSAIDWRTYFGMGNDHAGFNNFFPLTDDAQQAYFNEICRLTGVPHSVAVKIERTLPPANIVFIETEGKDAVQIEFLKANGYKVNVLDLTNIGLATAPQDTFDILNAADIVIIGRSCNSADYRDANAKAWMDSITTPVILNGQYVASDGKNRINWFEASAANHNDAMETLVYAHVADATDTVFTYVTVVGDSIPWTVTPDDFLAVDDTATKHYVAARNGGDVLVVQMEADSALYEGGPSAVGPRTYFGMGNDHVGFNNFFPLTDEAQQVYYNEIQRLLGRLMRKVTLVERTMRPLNVLLIEIDDREPRQREFLTANGFKLSVLDLQVGLASVGTDTIKQINDADVVIIGRSPMSSDYRGADAKVWMDSITSPVIVNSAYCLSDGVNRMNFFEASGAAHQDDNGELIYAQITDPTNFIYTNVTVVGDSLAWIYTPNDVLNVGDTATNHNIAARYGDAVLVVQIEADSAMYSEADTVKAVGPRTYFGFGNDHIGYENFFPLTDQAQQVYYNEILRLCGRSSKQVVTVEPTLSYRTSITVEPLGYGTVEGAGWYEPGTSVSAIAHVKDTTAFVNWTEDGTEVGTAGDTTYTFDMPSENVSLVANFQLDVKVDNKTVVDIISLQPVPAINFIDVNNVEGASIEVYSITGMLVDQFKASSNSVRINVSEYQSGMYILNVSMDGMTKSMKFIKK